MIGDMDSNLAIDAVFGMANDVMIEQVKQGELTLDNPQSKDLLVSWLRANLSKSNKILSVLEAWADLLYDDNMEKEYIIQFINRVREMSNSTMDTW